MIKFYRRNLRILVEMQGPRPMPIGFLTLVDALDVHMQLAAVIAELATEIDVKVDNGERRSPEALSTVTGALLSALRERVESLERLHRREGAIVDAVERAQRALVEDVEAVKDGVRERVLALDVRIAELERAIAIAAMPSTERAG